MGLRLFGDFQAGEGKGVFHVVEGGDLQVAELLLLETEGRLLAAAPASGRALFWMGEGKLQPGHAARLMGLGDIKRPDSDQPE